MSRIVPIFHEFLACPDLHLGLSKGSGGDSTELVRTVYIVCTKCDYFRNIVRYFIAFEPVNNWISYFRRTSLLTHTYKIEKRSEIYMDMAIENTINTILVHLKLRFRENQSGAFCLDTLYFRLISAIA